jgi:hypothetical protein
MFSGPFSISLDSGIEPDGVAIGRITLGNNVELFQCSLETFSREIYKKQWEIAIELAVRRRVKTCLFASIDVDYTGVGRAFFYSLIPSELAAGSLEFKTMADSIYITESFRTITVDPKNFLMKSSASPEYPDDFWDLPMYFFDSSEPSRFFGYLDECIIGISSWQYANSSFSQNLRIGE